MSGFFSWDRFFENLPKILPRLPLTFEIVGVSFVFGIVLALLIACVQIKKTKVISQLIRVFISFERGTPILVQMLVVYYALPMLLEGMFAIDTRGWGKIVFVDIALILNEGAFQAEIFRAAILAIPKGQTEAALSCGLTHFQAFMRIVLPQAFRLAIPPVGVNLIGLFRSTSLVSMIGVVDMIGYAQAIGSVSGHTIESYVILAIVFIIINFLLAAAFALIDKNLNKQGHRKLPAQKSARQGVPV